MGIANKVSAYNRERKYHYFKENIQFSSCSKILDVGFANQEYSPIDNYLEKHYPFPHKITALGIDENDLFSKRYPEVKSVRYDGGTFPFDDNAFDIGWSNAVIEHVGNREKQLFFIKELLRTCRVVYLTTPNVHFPVEVHTRTVFFHWLPKTIFDSYLNIVKKSWATGNYMHLLSRKELISLCTEAGAGKITVKGNRLMGFVMDYSVIIERFFNT